MAYRITTLSNFEKQFKRLEKKYPSLIEDISLLAESLKQNPMQGTSLGSGLFKVRLSVASKGKGKSGGARIITCVKIIQETVVLVAIYDKSEQETITVKELKDLLSLTK